MVDSNIKIPVLKGLNVTFDPPTAPKIKNRGNGGGGGIREVNQLWNMYQLWNKELIRFSFT